MGMFKPLNNCQKPIPPIFNTKLQIDFCSFWSKFLALNIPASILPAAIPAFTIPVLAAKVQPGINSGNLD